MGVGRPGVHKIHKSVRTSSGVDRPGPIPARSRPHKQHHSTRKSGRVLPAQGIFWQILITHPLFAWGVRSGLFRE